MPDRPPEPEVPASSKTDLESTASLLAQVRSGHPEARERLVRRYLPTLTRWAHGRLPYYARDLIDTDDLVQITLLKALDQVEGFEPRREGAFLAFLRRILVNKIRDEIRRVERDPDFIGLGERLPTAYPSPLETAIGAETYEAYEAALTELTDEQQEAVLLRIELGFTYREVAAALGSSSANAARMLVARGLIRLAEVMNGQK